MFARCILFASSFVLLTACGSMSREQGRAEPVGHATTTPATLPAPAPVVVDGSEAVKASAKSGRALLGTPMTTKPAAGDRGRTDATLALDHAPAPASLFGAQRTWKIDGHLFPGVSALDEREASALHGSYVMSFTSLVTPWERCDEPVSTAREATVEEWFASYDARELDDTDRATLHAKAGTKVMVHDLSCKDATQIELVEISNTKVAIARDGVIFTASRVN